MFRKKTTGPIFFSYKTIVSTPLVRPLVELLKAHGISAWLDEYGIGLNVQDEDELKTLIQSQIKTCVAAVLFVSEAYVLSKWCRFEAELLERRTENGEIEILVFTFGKAESFRENFPKLHEKSTSISGGFEDTLRALRNLSVLRNKKLSSVTMPGRPDAPSWTNRDLGFRFNRFDIWHPLRKTLFKVISRKEQVPSGDVQRDYVVFQALLGKHKIELHNDSELYLGPFAKEMATSKLTPDKYDKNDEDDKARLLAENELFHAEVKNAIKLIVDHRKDKDFFSISADLGSLYRKVGMKEHLEDGVKYEHLGTHVFSTEENGKWYRHRMFSFRVPGIFLCRLVKLVLPHPQFTRKDKMYPVAIRFIFCFPDQEKFFFNNLPFCNALIESFRWRDHRTTLDILREDLGINIKNNDHE